jgi:hypothetical protein
MTHEQMAEIIFDEFIEDIDKLYNMLIQFEDRWEKYAKQWQSYLSDEKKSQLDAVFAKFREKFPED